MFQQRRMQIAKQYFNAFEENELIDMPIVRPYVKHSWHLFVVKLNVQKLQCSRDEFKQQFANENIGSQIHFEPIHDQPYFSARFDSANFPFTTESCKRILSIPMYPKMNESDVTYVTTTIERLLKKNKKT